MPNNKTTRTAAGSGSIRQRPNGRWEARLTLDMMKEQASAKH